LEGNRLITLPPEIGNLTNLVELNVSNNQLSTIPSALGNLPYFWYLYMKGNPLNTIMYCSIIPHLKINKPDIILTYDPNPNPLTNDCSTGMNDLMVLASLWLSSPCNIANNWCNGADMTGDSDVDIDDFGVLAELWSRM
jgi:hypothetical protein